MTDPAGEQSARLDLNLVRVFVAIFETRSVTLAADRLGLTQPSVSHALAKLRLAYGDRLFTRGPSGLMTTPLCDQLARPLRDALSAVEATFDEARTFDPRQSTRRFRIAMSDIGALYFAPPLFRRFQECAQGVKVDIQQPSASLLDDLASGALDLAVGNLPELVASTRTVTLFQERYVCLLAEDHPWMGDAISIEDFARARHLLVTSPSSGHALVDGILASQGIVRNVVARVPQFSVLPYLVAHTDWLVVLPSRVARLFVRQGGLKSLDVPVPIPTFEVRAHWHARQQDSPAHRWLREELVDTLRGL
jgi:DNA-binding transcriptional LysR family regulator